MNEKARPGPKGACLARPRVGAGLVCSIRSNLNCLFVVAFNFMGTDKDDNKDRVELEFRRSV